jgi:hypothetical protein
MAMLGNAIDPITSLTVVKIMLELWAESIPIVFQIIAGRLFQ